MRFYLKKPRIEVDAIGEFDLKNREFVVLKGSKISNDIKYAPTFRGANTVEKLRSNNVKNNILTADFTFKSSSTAGNFVTGRSTNGPEVWKTEDGIKLKELLEND